MQIIAANNPIRLYFFSDGDYGRYHLGVYLAWCQPKQKTQTPIILPILAPLQDNIRDKAANKIPNLQDDGYHHFSVENYIKASAKTIAKRLNPKPRDASIWKPDSYKFSSVRMNLGSLNDCIDEGNRGFNVELFTSPYYSFNDMVANFYMDDGTLPVTLQSLKETANEAEEPIDDGLEAKLAMLEPPPSQAIN